MSKRIVIKPKCPGCKLGSDVVMRRPDRWDAKTAEYLCEACGSHLRLRAVLTKDGKELDTTVTVVKQSKALVDMLEEERMERLSTDASPGG